MDSITEHIKTHYDHPIIGVIGSTLPRHPYQKAMGERAGFLLRQYIADRGTLFTGGVEGVGVDVHRGLAQYCLEHEGAIPPEKFFVLVPTHTISPKESYQPQPYTIPNEYLATHTSLSMLPLSIEHAGAHMGERRHYVGQVADLLVCLNGGRGTVDEAITGLSNNVPVIALPATGGAAQTLLAFRHPHYGDIHREQASKMSIDVSSANFDLLHQATLDDLEETVEGVLSAR